MGEKKYAEARQLLEAIRQANPNAPDIDFSLGMVAMKEGNLKEAEDIFRKAYAANPKDARGLVGLVETLARQGHYDQAIQFLQVGAGQESQAQRSANGAGQRGGACRKLRTGHHPVSDRAQRAGQELQSRAARFISGWASLCAARAI